VAKNFLTKQYFVTTVGLAFSRKKQTSTRQKKKEENGQKESPNVARIMEQLASTQPGEVALDAFGNLTGEASELTSKAAAPALEIVGPFMTLLRGVKSFAQVFLA
jgi:hypothetical protein